MAPGSVVVVTTNVGGRRATATATATAAAAAAALKLTGTEPRA